uniref:Uncharacterized protein n=1 Tax=Anguilla anguilla TaxID=7936 RepID=A0A0E9PI09_ANGAN
MGQITFRYVRTLSMTMCVTPLLVLILLNEHRCHSCVSR